jgi:putative hydrolase of the HAD superfamily
LIFDLGGVIVPLDFERGYSVIEGLCPYRAHEIPLRIGGTDLVRRFETGKIETHLFFRELCALLSLNIDYERFREVWSSIFVPGSLLPDSLFADLKARGYRLILLSNTNAIHYEMARARYSPLKYFDRTVLSYEVGAMKPSPAIYAAAIEQAGCAPEECFFTDDISTYVEAAKRAGIDAVQFTSPQRLMEELAMRGVLNSKRSKESGV